jgi:hypothetical protein
MPGYRFNVRLGDNLTLDVEAQELPGIDEAAEDAKLILAELAKDAIRASSHAKLSMEVINEDGKPALMATAIWHISRD